MCPKQPAIVKHKSKQKSQEFYLLFVIAKFLKENPGVAQEQFYEMLKHKELKKFQDIVSCYRYDDFVEEIRDHGAGYIMTRIDFDRQMGF